MSIRYFAGLIGATLIVVAAAGLLWGLTVSEQGGFGSTRTIDCGSALRVEPWDGSSKLSGRYAEKLTDRCTEEAFVRRAIFWPIGALGAIVLAGAVLIRSGAPTTPSRSGSPSHPSRTSSPRE